MVSAESERISRFAHGGDAEGDVFFDGHAQFFRAFANVVAIYAARESFVLKFAFYRIGLDLEDALARFDEGARGEEACEFVAGIEDSKRLKTITANRHFVI